MADTTDDAGFAQDNAGRQRQLETLDRLAQRFGQSLSGALSAGTTSGKALDSVLGQIATKLTNSLSTSAISNLQSSLTGALQNGIGSLVGGLTLGSGSLAFAHGGVFSGGSVQPFASGGVVASPTYFPTASGLGLMGESGPEAIVPLARGSDGRLGVRQAGGGAANVTVNIQASDVDSFKRSEAQVSAALARAVARGRRAT